MNTNLVQRIFDPKSYLRFSSQNSSIICVMIKVHRIKTDYCIWTSIFTKKKKKILSFRIVFTVRSLRQKCLGSS